MRPWFTLRRRRRDQQLWLTHTPNMGANRVGAIVTFDGRPFVITCIRQTTSTRLLSGGSAPCYAVRGRPA